VRPSRHVIVNGGMRRHVRFRNRENQPLAAPLETSTEPLELIAILKSVFLRR
jgi:hypothetical protein